MPYVCYTVQLLPDLYLILLIYEVNLDFTSQNCKTLSEKLVSGFYGEQSRVCVQTVGFCELECCAELDASCIIV